MPDVELIGLVLLLAVAVIAGYFYLKRAQRRAGGASGESTVNDRTPPSDQ
jgi:Flp pilus assembly protein CpaB